MVLKHYLQQTLSSNIKNFKLRWSSYQRAKEAQNPGTATPPSDYTLKFMEEFRQSIWENWRTGFPWAPSVNPEWPWMWWPDRSELHQNEAVYLTPDGIALECRKWSKNFQRVDLPEWQRGGAQLKEWKSDYCVGVISTKKSWKHGWFEAEIRVPSGKGQWSAFWLMSVEGWPPEIDVFESYNPDGEVILKPNIHFGEGKHWREGKKDFGAPRIYLKNPQDRWVKYAVHWTDEWIRFYWDGHLVQECTIPEALKQNDKPQYIILNNGCKPGEELGFDPDESVMLIRNFKVYQKNKQV
jgi:beta-glucanase (GH16 family)